MSRLPHFLHNRLTDGGEVISRIALYPHEDSWYSFLLEAELTSGPRTLNVIFLHKTSIPENS
jgi:hypothetical protein